MPPRQNGSTSKTPPTWRGYLNASIALPSVSLTAWQAPSVLRYQELPTESRTWDEWLRAEFPSYVVAPMAERHTRLWGWFDGLTPGLRPRPEVEIWPRGGAKSTTAELGCAWVGRQRKRRFGLYICKTQDAANRHLQSIAGLFEQLRIDRAMNEYGYSKGWTRQMLRTANGFNMLAIGLDVGVRGVKFDELRPDLMVFDDVDDRHDSQATIDKKREIITESILPAEATNCAVLFIQNRIHEKSLAAELTDGQAEYLLDRAPVIQEPAVRDLVYERRMREDGTAYYKVISGTPTWEGQSLAVCEQQINSWGRRAFEREAQHRTKGDEDGLWRRARDLDPYRVLKAPELVRVVVGVDPSATATGDEAGVIVGGTDRHGHGFTLADLSVQGSPALWGSVARIGAVLFGADKIVAEANNGGQMVEMVIRNIGALTDEIRQALYRIFAPWFSRAEVDLAIKKAFTVPVKLVHASRGKLTRAEPVQALGEEGRIHHVSVFDALEDELCSWKPGELSPNRLDAYVWTFTELMLGGKQPPKGIMPGGETRSAPWSI